jgi:phosphate transport system ATP-binding protein
MSSASPLLADPLPGASAPPALQLDALSVAYGGRVALREVSFSAPAGSVTALVGPSGCGKTSLLNCLNRLTDLLPGCTVDGRLRLFGEDVLAPDRDLLALRRRVGMIFQRPNPFERSTRRNIDLPLREHGVRHPGERAARVEQALRDVGLWPEVCHRLDRPALELSGGQRQRLCIARAIALEPQVLLMDEPCSGLDPQATAAIEALIAAWRGRYTVLIVTHNLAQARRVADYTAVFWTEAGVGRLVEHGPTPAVFATPRHPAAADYLAGRSG